jgi:DNA-binding transcriptional regulator GbsR (MarR family)
MNIMKALLTLKPGAQWSLDGDTYDGLQWLDKTQSKPTKEEVEAEVEKLQAEYEAKEYQRQRAPEYPDIKDQLDAIWKGGDAYEEMLAKIMEVKAKYPKPE